MRKYVFMLVAIVAAMSLSSCKGDKGDPGLGMNWKIIDIPAYDVVWDYTNWVNPIYQDPYVENYYYATFDIPSLSAYIFDKGAVHAYLIYKNDYNDEIQRPLPFTQHRETWVTVDTEDGLQDQLLRYTETYDYVYGVGCVEFNYRASDFSYEDSLDPLHDPGVIPQPQHFRLVFNW
ncbi:MAG: hypothetical protein KBS70_06260 [Bacteroidales bacterium]|nr:hypothetical protein [Candidatus Colicola equi]